MSRCKKQRGTSGRDFTVEAVPGSRTGRVDGGACRQNDGHRRIRNEGAVFPARVPSALTFPNE